MKWNNLIRAMGVAIAVVVATMSLSDVRGDAVAPSAQLLWHATSGHVLKAEFIDLKEGVVMMKGEDGQVRNVPLNLLVAEDQAIAKTLAERAAAAAIVASTPLASTPPAAKDRLPVFAEGPGKGFFAFYANPNFIVRVNDKAVATIICLEGDKPVGKPILVKLGHSYLDPETHVEVNRGIVSFDEGYAPMLQPDSITLTGLLKDDVRFGYNLTIKDNTIQTWGWMEDPPKLKTPSVCIPSFAFSASHTFDNYMLVVDQKVVVKDMSFVGNPVSGKTFTLPYGDMPKGFNVPLASAEIKGPVFGSRHVSLSIKRSQAAEMRFWTLGHGPLFTGFEVRMLKKKQASREDTVQFSLTID